MKVYAASSWKNTRHPEVVKALRDAGHEVYDYRNPPHGKWDENHKWWETETYEPVLFPNIIGGVPERQLAWDTDWAELEKCDAVVLTLPSGRSAHLEAGFAAGARKCMIVLGEPSEEPELMYNMATYVCTEIHEVVEELQRQATAGNDTHEETDPRDALLSEIWRAMSRDSQPSTADSGAWLGALGELVLEAGGKRAAEDRARESEDLLKTATMSAMLNSHAVSAPTIEDLEARMTSAEEDARKMRMAIRRIKECEKRVDEAKDNVETSEKLGRQAKRDAHKELGKRLDELIDAMKALDAINAETA